MSVSSPASFSCSGGPRDLHSFPTRRSSDLAAAEAEIPAQLDLGWSRGEPRRRIEHDGRDRKSTRLNSSHVETSYAVFCLKKKKNLLRSRVGLGCRALTARFALLSPDRQRTI